MEDGFIYIDKTTWMYKLVTEGIIYFFCHPHRFCKSLLISTLNTYFHGKRELFKGLTIESLEQDGDKYPVFIWGLALCIVHASKYYYGEKWLGERLTNIHAFFLRRCGDFTIFVHSAERAY